MSRNRGKRYSQKERDELVELYRQSGYGVWKFCQEMNLGYETLNRWLEKETPKVSLVEVTTDESTPTGSIALTIRLPNGIECGLGSRLTLREAITLIRGLKAC